MNSRKLLVALALGGTDRGRSGISTFVRAVLPGLRAGLEAAGGALIAFGAEGDRAAFAPELAGISFHETPRAFDAPGPNALWHLLRAGALAKRLGADVLLLPAANRRLTALSPIPTVAVVHDLSQLQVAAKFDRLRMFYARNVMLAALARATELLAVSGATQGDLMQALGLSRGRIRLVPNGVDALRFAPMDGAHPRVAAARQATSLEGKYLLYPARLEHPGKNHLRLLQAFAASESLRGHRLALSGADFGAGPMVRTEIARLGLGDRVRVLGFVSDEHHPALVAGADAIAMIGLHEGFGLPALEALAAGRAVAASNTGALPEVVGHLAALCDPRSVESLKRALERAAGDVELRARAAAEGPAWAAARGWDKTVEGLLASCADAARAKSGSRSSQSGTARVSS